MKILQVSFLKMFAITIALFLSQIELTQATVYTWSGGSGSWTNPQQWIPVGIPGAGDEVWIFSGGQIHIQSTFSLTVGSIWLQDNSSLEIRPNASLSIENYNLGPAINNRGAVFNLGTLHIHHMSGNQGYGIQNYGLFVNNTNALLQLDHLSQVAIYNYSGSEFRNAGTLEITDLDDHAIVNAGDFINHDQVYIEACPEKYKWGIVNNNTIENNGDIEITRAHLQSLEEGGIRNSGPFTNNGSLDIHHMNFYGIVVIKGPFVNHGSIGSEYLERYGIRVYPYAEFRNEAESDLRLAYCQRIGLYTQGDFYNDGNIFFVFNRFADLNVAANAYLENEGSIKSFYPSTSYQNHKSMKIAGDMENKSSGRIEIFHKFLSTSTGEFTNEGLFISWYDGNNVVNGNKFRNNRVLSDVNNSFDNLLVNDGIVAKPYTDPVIVGQAALDFLDIEDNLDVTITTDVFDAPYNPATILGSYTQATNQFVPNSNAVGFDSVWVHATIPNAGNPRMCVKLSSPILPFAPSPVALNNVSANNDLAFNIYPNPCTEIINISTAQMDDSSYSIFDQTGMVVQSGILMNQQIKVSTLAQGIYQLRIQIEDQNKSFSFIKD